MSLDQLSKFKHNLTKFSDSLCPRVPERHNASDKFYT
jgi:hypothetical protein